jgi:hypothetical protein
VVAADHPRRLDWAPAASASSRKAWGCAKNILTVRLRALVERRHPEDCARLRRQRLSGICADTEGPRTVFPVLVALRQWSEEFDERA